MAMWDGVYPNLERMQRERKWTNRYVAERVGCSVGAYARNKRSGGFRTTVAKKLVELFDCPMHMLFAQDTDSADQTQAG